MRDEQRFKQLGATATDKKPVELDFDELMELQGREGEVMIEHLLNGCESLS